MTTVLEFTTAIQGSGEIKSPGNTNVPTALRRSLLKALSRISSLRTVFTEATFSFTSVANQSDYDSGTSGYPVDVASFEHIEVDDGQGVYLPLHGTGLPEVRELLRSASVLADPRRPFLYCFAAGKLSIAPPPPSAVTVRGWYHRDARRDSKTGALIGATAASDGAENVWLDDGHDPLWNLTLQIFHLAFAVDAERAAYYGSEYETARKELKLQWARKTRPYFVARAVL